MNSAGCHNDNINGGFHCHDGGDSGGGSWWAGAKEVISNIDPTEEEPIPKADDNTIKDIEALEAAFPQNVVSSVKLKSVVDGDTIIITENGKDYKVRLYGIDCPEGNQQLGLDANSSLFFLLAQKDLTIEAKDYDKYGRVVAVVYADDEDGAEFIRY